jgi:hypothetical protein
VYTLRLLSCVCTIWCFTSRITTRREKEEPAISKVDRYIKIYIVYIIDYIWCPASIMWTELCDYIFSTRELMCSSSSPFPNALYTMALILLCILCISIDLYIIRSIYFLEFSWNLWNFEIFFGISGISVHSRDSKVYKKGGGRTYNNIYSVTPFENVLNISKSPSPSKVSHRMSWTKGRAHHQRESCWI